MERNRHIEITDDVLMSFLLQETTEEQRLAVEQWLEENEENTRYFNELRRTWELTNDENTFKPNVDAAWENIRGKLKDTPQKVIPLTPKHSSKRYLFATAASVIVIVGCFTLYNLFGTPSENILVAKADLQELKLMDGSEVELTKGTRLTYPENFSENERRVALSGTAFFDIQKNPEKPFTIDLPNELHVKVLGTSFTIQANSGESSTEVTVKTGTVEFGSSKESIVLVAGEVGKMNHQTGKFSKLTSADLLQKERIKKRKKLAFDRVELSEVVSILNELYEDSVRLDCNVSSNAPIVSVHENESLEKILTIISAVHGLKMAYLEDESTYILSCDEP